jgi:Cu-Zn family superoxide dismutase
MVYISGTIVGLNANGVHGIHIHNKSVTNQDCATAAAHWNPKNVSHSSPLNTTRHYGDLGNLVANSTGGVTFSITSSLFNIYSQDNEDATARAIVIHELADDLGVPGTSASLSTGNAGARLACGNLLAVTSAAGKQSVALLAMLSLSAFFFL